MTDYTIEVNTENWYCGCCGSGTHFDITLFDKDKRLWGTSYNDQFGGTYRDGDDEFILTCAAYGLDIHDALKHLSEYGKSIEGPYTAEEVGEMFDEA